MTFSEYKWGPQEGLNSAGDPERVQMGVQRGPDWEEGGGGVHVLYRTVCLFKFTWVDESNNFAKSYVPS